eukprot:TRINITY_DN6711_c2_g1_i1.p1 TRINITY_DN6711_c2_g1~~TRINITY_DN6711_c2_g1_i1.p1  ORF type:complete len:267 (+),score=29.35 TRINITY_DN6711_c2_g1_i1:58-858(+)
MTNFSAVDLEYLVKHDVARTLEILTRSLLETKPERVETQLIDVLKEMRVKAKTKTLEGFMSGSGITPDDKGELDKHFNAIVSLERDESIQSENSTFSINSSDMSEFLTDIREAYAQVSKSKILNGRVSKDDLGNIIDLIAYPIPEKVLCEMFSEVDTDKIGTIDFVECLARMTFKIQGRFHIDALRPVFHSVAGESDTVFLEPSLIPTVLGKLGLHLPDGQQNELPPEPFTFTSFVTLTNALTGCRSPDIPCSEDNTASPLSNSST